MVRTTFTLSFATLCGLAVGILVGGLYLAIQHGANINTMNPLYLLDNLPTLERVQTAPYRESYLMVLAAIVVCLILAAIVVFRDNLTIYGDAHFQNKNELRRNGMLAPVGSGLLFGKFVRPPAHPKGKPITISKRHPILAKKNAPFVSASYDLFPNAMVCAPTGAGKTVSYVIPVALTFPGSMVILDVKGEIFEETSRHRANVIGDKVYRFSPFDFENPSHQYNPLFRISKIKNLEQQFTELQKVTSLFLQVEGAGAKDFVEGGGELVVAAGLLAIERGNATFGEIYRIIYGSGREEDVGENASQRLLAAAKETTNPTVRQILSEYAGHDQRIRDSYLSVLKTAGLRQWSNPKVERITRRNDIDFTTIRKVPQTIYLVVASDDIEPLSSLIRLFFTELMAFLRHSTPGKDEPFPVKILLDEFDQLGHMPIFVKGIKQVRGHGGRISMITQSIPGLQTIYTENERQSLEAGAGVKLYISANEDVTAKEIETSLGTRTGLAVSHSYDRGDVGMAKGSVSKHSEDRPLLSAAQIRRLDDDKVIILPQRQQPVLADKIKFYQDPFLRPLWENQTGAFPYPSKESEEQANISVTVSIEQTKVANLEKKVEALTNELKAVRNGKEQGQAVSQSAGKIAQRRASQRVAPREPVADEDQEIVRDNVNKLNEVLQSKLAKAKRKAETE
ncbi:type IV secretory system conjugative DNA transfer family protein [uncultured Tateyamaria sp.]|uniref:type IV secretory system conjugative DNA transfer family protein n=1 Tax=uncultured Tateyamaria sp. TaxID=455651 RepID=UPI00260DA1AF|nr:type IV secretory system conjugative DNA transfer family protein [uncultured Tateyamaria sp.]